MPLFRRREPPLDPFERAARRSDPELATLEEVHDVFLPQLRGKNLLLLFAVLVAVVAVLRDGIGSGAPKVERSCSTAAFSLRSTEVRRDGVVTWSATGPSSARIAFGLDTTSLPADRDAGLLAGPVALTDCLVTGRFGVSTEPGEHEVTAYLVSSDGTATVIGKKAITVSDR